MTTNKGYDHEFHATMGLDSNDSADRMHLYLKLDNIVESSGRRRKHYTFHYWTVYKDGTEAVEYRNHSRVKVVFRVGGCKIYYRVVLTGEKPVWQESSPLPGQSDMDEAVMNYVTTLVTENAIFNTEHIEP